MISPNSNGFRDTIVADITRRWRCRALRSNGACFGRVVYRFRPFSSLLPALFASFVRVSYITRSYGIADVLVTEFSRVNPGCLTFPTIGIRFNHCSHFENAYRRRSPSNCERLKIFSRLCVARIAQSEGTDSIAFESVEVGSRFSKKIPSPKGS